MMKRKPEKVKILISALVLVMSNITVAQTSETSSTAQAPQVAPVAPTNPEATTTSDGKQVERVEVIGSRIKRIAKEGASAVQKLDKESMKNSANTSASESLRDSTAATYGASRESAGSNAAATATIGLRGLGDTRTLVLLNGHRLPKDPSVEAVDLNLIPQSAIERIEILKDGASALYGSDALGGVVNIITKKGYTGNEGTVKLATVNKPGGTVYDVSLLSGVQTEKLDLMAALTYQHTDKVFGKDRDLTKDQLSSTGSAPAWKNTGSPWQVSSECPAEFKKPVGAGFKCFFPYNAIATTKPQIAQLNLLTDLTYRLDSGIKLYNRNLVVHKDISWSYAPTPGTFANGDPTHTDELPTGTATNPTAQQVAYRYMNAGNRNNEDSEMNYSTLVGLKDSLTSIWDYDLSVGYSEINRQSKGISGYLDKKVLIDAIAAGTHDPTAPLGDARRDLPAGAMVEVYQKSVSNLLTADLVMTGELGELPAGPIGVATGVSVFNEKLKQETDPLSLIQNRVIGTAGSQDSGSRDVQSAFIEAAIPVFSSLEVDAAARLDHYSDFGTSINPKLSLKYTINPSVLIRTSAGTGFKAPTLSQLYGAASDGYQTFIDRKLCKLDSSQCDANQYHVFGGGNKDLKEEKAFSASLGTVVQPTSNISFSVDGWYTKVTNIVSLDFEAMTEAESNGVDLNKYGIKVNRDPSDNSIITVNAPNLNLASEEITGVDFNLDAVLVNNLIGHQLTFSDDYSYIVSDMMEPFPGVSARNLIGEWGMPRWRNTASLHMKSDVATYSLSMRSIAGQNIQDKDTISKIAELKEYDLAASYKLSKSSQFSGGIKNIFDAKQPVDAAGGTGGTALVNESLYDINGRKFFVSYTEKF